MKILTTFLITTAALLLTSCGGVGWNLFYCVRELPNTCTGVDLTKPVGGTVYVPQSKAVDKFPSAVVMQVPEVTYSPSTRPGLPWRLCLYQPSVCPWRGTHGTHSLGEGGQVRTRGRIASRTAEAGGIYEMVAGTEQENPPPRDAGALPWQEQLGPSGWHP